MCFCRAATNVLDILPQFVAHQCTRSSPCVSSAAKVSSWIDIKATCDKRFFFHVVTAFVAHIEVHTSTDSQSNESTLMRVAVPRGSTSTRGRQSRRVMRQRVVVKANTTCVDLWLFEHFSCEPSKENSVTSRKPLGPLQIVTPFGVHPRLSQLVVTNRAQRCEMHKLALFWWVGGLWSCVQVSVVAILAQERYCARF